MLWSGIDNNQFKAQLVCVFILFICIFSVWWFLIYFSLVKFLALLYAKKRYYAGFSGDAKFQYVQSIKLQWPLSQNDRYLKTVNMNDSSNNFIAKSISFDIFIAKAINLNDSSNNITGKTISFNILNDISL